MTSDRDRFTAALFAGPLRRADAVVLLCGEDAIPRADCAFQLYKQGAAPLIALTGALDDPPAKQDAARVTNYLLGQGIAADRLRTVGEATNTCEQASEVVTLAMTEKWTALALVASAYHLPRAYLTFLAALTRRKLAKRVRLIPVPATPPWFRAPDGVQATRLELLATEFSKIDEYGEFGHVASYASGLDYLRHWEAA